MYEHFDRVVLSFDSFCSHNLTFRHIPKGKHKHKDTPELSHHQNYIHTLWVRDIPPDLRNAKTVPPRSPAATRVPFEAAAPRRWSPWTTNSRIGGLPPSLEVTVHSWATTRHPPLAGNLPWKTFPPPMSWILKRKAAATAPRSFCISTTLLLRITKRCKPTTNKQRRIDDTIQIQRNGSNIMQRYGSKKKYPPKIQRQLHPTKLEGCRNRNRNVVKEFWHAWIQGTRTFIGTKKAFEKLSSSVEISVINLSPGALWHRTRFRDKRDGWSFNRIAERRMQRVESST